jgi:hypothetical protein
MNGLASMGHLMRLGSVSDRCDGVGKKDGLSTGRRHRGNGGTLEVDDVGCSGPRP